jgi:hypothetical protein
MDPRELLQVASRLATSDMQPIRGHGLCARECISKRAILEVRDRMLRCGRDVIVRALFRDANVLRPQGSFDVKFSDV